MSKNKEYYAKYREQNADKIRERDRLRKSGKQVAEIPQPSGQSNPDIPQPIPQPEKPLGWVKPKRRLEDGTGVNKCQYSAGCQNDGLRVKYGELFGWVCLEHIFTMGNKLVQIECLDGLSSDDEARAAKESVHAKKDYFAQIAPPKDDIVK